MTRHIGYKTWPSLLLPVAYQYKEIPFILCKQKVIGFQLASLYIEYHYLLIGSGVS